MKLDKVMTIKDMVIFGMLFMVPIAPFGIYGYLAKDSYGMTSLVYLVGVIAMIFTAYSYAQMSKAVPSSGSVYAYASKSFGAKIGFLFGWIILADYILAPAILYIVSAVAFSSLSGIPTVMCFFMFLIFNTIINFYGLKLTVKVNRVVLVFQLIVLACFLFVGINALSSGVDINMNKIGFSEIPFYNAEKFDLGFVMGAVSLAVFSFIGFDGISTLAEEHKGAKEDVGKAMYITLVIVACIFLAQTYVAGSIMPNYEDIKDPDAAFYEIAYLVGNNWLKNLCEIGTIIAWGTTNAIAAQSAVSRIIYAMSRDKTLPTKLSKLHHKHHTPYVAIYTIGFITAVVGMIFLNSLDTLANLINFGALIAFMGVNASALYYYKVIIKSKDIKTFILPLIGVTITFYVWYHLDIAAMKLGFAWFSLGLLVMFLNKNIGKSMEKVEEIEKEEILSKEDEGK